MDTEIADRSVRQLHDLVADPDAFVGGGTAAAETAAAAAAAAELVLALAARRKANVDRRAELQAALKRAHALREHFYAAANEDIAVLDRLLQAQRAQRATGNDAGYLAALEDAARSPIDVAERALELVELLASTLDCATRFTVSDLGAAACLADGAARAALLTAEVNMALLAETAGADTTRVARLADRIRTLREAVGRASHDVEERTRRRVHGTKDA